CLRDVMERARRSRRRRCVAHRSRRRRLARHRRAGHVHPHAPPASTRSPRGTRSSRSPAATAPPWTRSWRRTAWARVTPCCPSAGGSPFRQG
ncbi:MAG: hypothetical protein AVDCRST_MAG77-329, partial [uncultured Chloroflexi bacterium]